MKSLALFLWVSLVLVVLLNTVSVFAMPPIRHGTRDELRIKQALADALKGAEYNENRMHKRGKGIDINNSRSLRYPDLNPNPFVIPPGAPTVKFGRTWTATFGSTQQVYAITEERGFSTAVFIVNSRGGIMINGTAHYIEMIAYNDGAECANMVILYERLINLDQVDLLFTPVHYDCTEIALLAEKYQMPLINTADYTLPISMDLDPSYQNLFWTFDLCANYWTIGAAVVSPAHHVGARSYAVVYNPEIPFYGPDGEAAALAKGMINALNKTILLSLAEQDTIMRDPTRYDNCSYVNPIIDEIILASPDLLMFTFGAYSHIFIDCMHRKRYHPPAFWNIASANFLPEDLWQLHGSIGTSIWARSEETLDKYLVSSNYYRQTFEQLWNISTTIKDIGYEATHGAGVAIAALALERSQSFAPLAIAQQLAAMNDSTIIGHVYILNKTRHYNHPYYGTQRPFSLNGTITTISPVGLPGVKNLTYPVLFTAIVTPQYLRFLRSLQDRGLKAWAWGLIAVAITVFAIGIVAGIIFVFFRQKFHLIFIPKDLGDNNEEWGDVPRS